MLSRTPALSSTSDQFWKVSLENKYKKFKLNENKPIPSVCNLWPGEFYTFLQRLVSLLPSDALAVRPLVNMLAAVFICKFKAGAKIMQIFHQYTRISLMSPAGASWGSVRNYVQIVCVWILWQHISPAGCGISTAQLDIKESCLNLNSVMLQQYIFWILLIYFDQLKKNVLTLPAMQAGQRNIKECKTPT